MNILGLTVRIYIEIAVFVYLYTGLDKLKFSAYDCNYFLSSIILTYVLGAQNWLRNKENIF